MPVRPLGAPSHWVSRPAQLGFMVPDSHTSPVLADYAGVDLGTGLVTVLAAAVALLPRVPAFTAEGREQAQIQRDVELWNGIPHGDVRDRLGAEIEERTTALLQDRKNRSPLEDASIVGLRWAATGWVLLVASTGLTRDGGWVPHVLLALQVGGLIAGAVGGVIIALTAGSALRRAVVAGWRQRRRQRAPDYQI